MEDRYSFSRQGSGVWRSLRDGDFEEEDIWEVLKERQDSATKVGKSTETSYVPVRRNLPSAARMIPRTFSATNNNNSSSSSSSSHEANNNGGVKQRQQQYSAPVNIPDYWSKISSNKSNKAWHHVDDDGDGDGDGDGGDVENGVMNGEEDGDEEEEYNSKVPPHEFLARRLARSQISSFSVFEGVGRKLKGRDLRKVRNAVLTKTGFLE